MNSDMMEALENIEREKGISRRSCSRRSPTRSSPPTSACRTRPRRRWSRSTSRPATSTSSRRSSTRRARSSASGTTRPTDFGRIAAQTAKQVILQRIREAEREMKYEEYAGREGDIVTGIIQQTDAALHAARPRPGRGAAAAGRAGPGRALRPRQPHEGLHRRGPQDRQGPADRRVAHAPRPRAAPVRARGPRARRRRGRDPRRRPRARPPHQARGRVQRPATSTRSARASAPAASASARSSTSCAARRSTSSPTADGPPSSS